jgi:ABC-2 type transport system ATP-binding protein
MDLVIDVKNLNKSFAGKQAVFDASLQVKKGEIYGFLGPNGSGKTTTIRMICGLLSADSGEGTCLGFDVLHQSDDIKRNVGYMTQAFSLYKDLSIEQNLDFVARMYQMSNRKQSVQESLEQLGLYERRKQLAGDLSGGWKQRLALAAAVIHKPQLLLLDEPTAGVDPQARRDFWDQVQLMSQRGITTLVTTHYMDEAMRCNQLAYIVYGRMMVHGTAEEIIEKSGLKTWQVSGSNLLEIKDKLLQNNAIEQAAMFGNVLHVSGHDASAIEAVFSSVLTSEYTATKINTSLEDVFIMYVDKNKDMRHE